MTTTRAIILLGVLTLGFTAGAADAGGPPGTCGGLPGWSDLRQSLIAANGHVNLILNNNMWATIVAADGTVCAVANTGNDDLESQWLLSRVISAQKANTANGLSLRAGEGPNSTSRVWRFPPPTYGRPSSPGGNLFGLQLSNPVNTDVAYRGSAQAFGTSHDAMVGGRIGGVNVFGGGLALYDKHGRRVGGVGVSGDTSCRDHMVAWELRHNLGLDFVPNGVTGDPTHPDNIIFDVNNGFGHPTASIRRRKRGGGGAHSSHPAAVKAIRRRKWGRWSRP